MFFSLVVKTHPDSAEIWRYRWNQFSFPMIQPRSGDIGGIIIFSQDLEVYLCF